MAVHEILKMGDPRLLRLAQPVRSLSLIHISEPTRPY